MTYRIPSQRPSDDVRPMPGPLVGPVCPVCDHPSCRTRRAQRLPRLGGHRSEFAREHAQAAGIAARQRHLIVYFGEATQSFWVVGPYGLREAADIDALLILLWPHSERATARRQASNVAGSWARPGDTSRVLTLA